MFVDVDVSDGVEVGGYAVTFGEQELEIIP